MYIQQLRYDDSTAKKASLITILMKAMIGDNDTPEMTPHVSKPLEMVQDGFVDDVGHSLVNAIETGLCSLQPTLLKGHY